MLYVHVICAEIKNDEGTGDLFLGFGREKMSKTGDVGFVIYFLYCTRLVAIVITEIYLASEELALS